MARPRKRKRWSSTNHVLYDDDLQKKKLKTHSGDYQSHHPHQSPPFTTVRHAVLDQFYPHVYSLRGYLLSRLPPTSRIRRKKVAAVGRVDTSLHPTLSGVERSVGSLLDNTLVGIPEGSICNPTGDRWERWTSFSQKGDESYVTLSDGIAGSKYSQSEVSASLFHPNVKITIRDRLF